MKLLWFTNTACSAAADLGIKGHRGGWLASLEEEISRNKDIELHICFYYSKKHEPFTRKGIRYYPVERKNTGSKAGRYLNRIFRKNNADDSEVSLLLSVIETVQPDLIHIHGTEENFGLIQDQCHFPVMISLQGILSPYAEKYFSGIPRVTAGRYESITQKMSFKSAAAGYTRLELKAGRERKILLKTKYIVGRTAWDKRVTRLLAPCSNYYINNEILRPSFYTSAWEKNRFNDKLRLVTISSGALFKGFETVVKTAMLLKNYPGLSFEWLAIGLTADSAIVMTVQKWLNANFDDLDIQLMGYKSEEEVVETLRQSDIYCQVSHIENSPNSLCEAMLLGMPVIATDAGGTFSMLCSGREGILFQDGDPYAVAGAIIELANDFPLAAQYGAHARQKAMERHNRTNIGTGLAEIYAQVIADFHHSSIGQ